LRGQQGFWIYTFQPLLPENLMQNTPALFKGCMDRRKCDCLLKSSLPKTDLKKSKIMTNSTKTTSQFRKKNTANSVT
jgi:hypothetical protein